MPQPAITIVGAGLGGLTLGRCLLKHGISAVVYDRALSKPRHNYGVTLHASSCQPLLKFLGVEEQTFRRLVAVDAGVGGSGAINRDSLACSGNLPSNSFRAHRARLERFLSEELDVRWEQGVKGIRNTPDGRALSMSDSNQIPLNGYIVGADGPHSVIRKSILPDTLLNVLPFVAFNGKRRIERTLFDNAYAPSMKESSLIQLKRNDVLFQISVDDYQNESVSISWTYSRPARGTTDPLHKPNRSNVEATSIPEELFHEISALHDLPQPFHVIFAFSHTLKQDRILHWLMRTTLPSLQDLQAAAQTGVLFIGDAVHAEPIIGGEGANTAILDGVELAEWISKNETQRLGEWYAARYPAWEAHVRKSQVTIAEMHGVSKLAL